MTRFSRRPASYTPGSAAGSKTPSLTVTASAGSPSPGLWVGAQAPAAKFNPLFTIKPGQSRTIDLKITPSRDGTAGTVVHGTLYVDVFAAFNEFQLGGLSGSDVTGVRYEYKIG